MNQNITGEQHKEWAKLLFTQHKHTIKEVAKTIDIEEAVVRKWVKDNNWEEIRLSLLVSKEFQLSKLYNLLDRLTTKMNDDIEINTKEVDLTIKYTAAIKNLEVETGLLQIVEVAKLFTTWLSRKDKEIARMITIELDAFIKYRINMPTL